MTYTLWHGDCLEEMSRIEDGSIDCILADLPFGRTACAWDVVIPFEPLWRQYKRVIKRNGAIVLFGTEPFSSLLRLSNLDWYKYDWVWDKVIGSNFQLANYQPLKRHENIMVFSGSPAVYVKSGNCMVYNPQMFRTNPANIRPLKDGRWNQNMTRIRSGDVIRKSPGDISFPTSIIEANKNKAECNNTRRLAPTQKPVSLLSYLIKTYTNEGDTILDNTCGSGSTLEAAMRNNRRSIGIEKDAHYFSVAQQRLERVAAELRGELNHLPMFREVAPV